MIRESVAELEYTEVRFRLPRAVHDFLKALVEFTGVDLEGLLQAEMEKTVRNIIDELSKVSYIDREALLHRYGLDSPRDP